MSFFISNEKGSCDDFDNIPKGIVLKKDGTIKASQKDHLLKQHECLLKLTSKGYKAEFSWGFDMTKKIIDEYLTQ